MTRESQTQTGLGDYADGQTPDVDATREQTRTSDDHGESESESKTTTRVEYYDPTTDRPPLLKKGGDNPTLFVEEGVDAGNRVGEIVDIVGSDGRGTDPDRPEKAFVRQVDGSRHRVRAVGDSDGGYGASTGAFRKAVAAGARLVIVSDTHYDAVYEWPIDAFRRDLDDVISTPEPQKYGTVADAVAWNGHTDDLFVPRGVSVDDYLSDSDSTDPGADGDGDGVGFTTASSLGRDDD